MDKKNEKIVVWVGVGLAVYLVFNVVGGISALAEMFGLKEKQDTKDLNNSSTDPTNFWNPNFYTTGPVGTLLLTQAAAGQMAASIWRAFGPFDDNEELVKGVLKQLKTQSQVSFLAKVFYQDYKTDLLSYLRGTTWPYDRLSDADVNELNNYISKLPKYKL